jgi:hypothetical protein
MILIAIRLRRPAGQEFLELVGLGHARACGFRFNPAGCSEMKPAGILI